MVHLAIQEADLLIGVGMRFDDRVTGKLSTFAPNAKIVHIDIDPAEISKNVKCRCVVPIWSMSAARKHFCIETARLKSGTSSPKK